jgi:hypothetical protein
MDRYANTDPGFWDRRQTSLRPRWPADRLKPGVHFRQFLGQPAADAVEQLKNARRAIHRPTSVSLSPG